VNAQLFREGIELIGRQIETEMKSNKDKKTQTTI
jgi:hypothetical protein